MDSKKAKAARRKIFDSLSIRTKVITCISTVLILGAFVFYIYPSFIFSKPLGEKLEYIGKTDYGCWIGFCDSRPASTYYYATDMNTHEIIHYFKKARLINGDDVSKTDTYFGIKTSSGETIYISIHNKDYFYREHPNFRQTDKKNILAIPSFKYKITKASL